MLGWRILPPFNAQTRMGCYEPGDAWASPVSPPRAQSQAFPMRSLREAWTQGKASNTGGEGTLHDSMTLKGPLNGSLTHLNYPEKEETMKYAPFLFSKLTAKLQ